MDKSTEHFSDEKILDMRKEFIEELAGYHLLMFVRLLPIDRSAFFKNIGKKLNVDNDTVEMYTKRKLPKKYLGNEFVTFIHAIMYSLKKYSDDLKDQQRKEFLDIWRDKRSFLLGQLEEYKMFYQRCNIDLEAAHNKDSLVYQRELIALDFLTGHYPECLGKKVLDVEDINKIRLAFLTVFPDWRKRLLKKTKEEEICCPPLTKKDNKNEIDLDFHDFRFRDF